ncbi:MAG TPA: carboxypeptidase regulatory-like domain-containing protein [Anaerolineae bacterium]|nr:carboxypeptidase regulatory-like domain-containing protein [Anaerolineae bacterium]
MVNGTANGGSVEGLAVTLRVFAGMEEQSPQTATTDAEGRFRFEGLSTEANHGYALLLNYQGVDYGSDLLTFSEGETTLSIPIQVYEPTESDEAISIERAHIFVDFQGNSLVVGEMYLFSNGSDRTYIGAEEVAEGRRGTLRLPLPAGAEGLAFESGELGQRFFETDEGFVDTWPLRPGQASGQLMFRYSLPYSPSGYDLVRDIPYPLKAVNVLVADVGVDVTSDQLTLEGSRGMQGQSYLNLSGQNLSKGERLTLHFSGSPSNALDSEPVEGGETVPVQTPQAGNQLTLRWAALGLAVLAVGFALGYPLLRRQPKVAAGKGVASDLERREQELLSALADLDDDFEAGQITEKVYKRERARKKAELAEIMRRLER